MIEPKLIKIGNLTLKEIIDNHHHWLRKDCEGWESMRADLSYASLRGADLYSVNLYGADLCDADLSYTNLSCADLSNAHLCGADLCNANLYCAKLDHTDLRYANMCGADLRYVHLNNTDLSYARLGSVNLYYTDLRHVNLHGADLNYANLCGADLRNIKGKYAEYIKGKILSEPIIGYKICNDDIIVTLEIPRGAIVFSINGNKFRTNKVKVISIDGHDRAYSEYNHMSYYVGDEITVYNFNCEYNLECASGIHFFMTREEAENYGYNNNIKFIKIDSESEGENVES